MLIRLALICTFVVHIWLKQVFSWRGSFYDWLCFRLACLSVLKISNGCNLHQIQHFQWQSNVFIHMGSHASWRKMDNDVTVTRITMVLTWIRRQFCLPLTAGNFLNISRIQNGNILYFIPNERQVSSHDISCIYFATASISSVVLTLFQPRWQREMAVRFFLQVGHLAKVVLLWTCLLNSMQYQRIMVLWKQRNMSTDSPQNCRLLGA